MQQWEERWYNPERRRQNQYRRSPGAPPRTSRRVRIDLIASCGRFLNLDAVMLESGATVRMRNTRGGEEIGQIVISLKGRPAQVQKAKGLLHTQAVDVADDGRRCFNALCHDTPDQGVADSRRPEKRRPSRPRTPVIERRRWDSHASSSNHWGRNRDQSDPVDRPGFRLRAAPGLSQTREPSPRVS